MTTNSPTGYRRHMLGICGMVLLATGVYYWIVPPSPGWQTFFQGSCIKSGLVLSVTWLAFPKLDQMSPLLFGSLLVALLIVALRPRLIPILAKVAMIVAPVLVLLWLLRVKPNRNGA
ncbi:MAG: hypothetical protein KDB27_18875 [Planctomycetales bacterium]|nr:hypothetical protein [Planctomycetales bacterium]